MKYYQLILFSYIWDRDDNLPADLLSALVEYLQRSGYSNIAVSIDVRSANSVQRLPPLLQQIKQDF